jgi:putative ABC transport system substrate-binding protein
MRRRDFIALCAALGISSLAHAQAQAPAQAQQARLHRVGVLLLGIADAESFKAELREGLRTSGYKEGQNIAFEFRSAEGKEALLPKLAAELVAHRGPIHTMRNRSQAGHTRNSHCRRVG